MSTYNFKMEEKPASVRNESTVKHLAPNNSARENIGESNKEEEKERK